MEVDKNITQKVINWQKWLPIGVSVLLLIGSGFLLYQNNLLKKQLQKQEVNTNSNTGATTSNLTKAEEEIKLCIEDKAKTTDTSKKAFSFQDFGLASSYFEGKEVEYTTYEYKRNKIIRKSIRPDEKTGTTWDIDIWELASTSYSLPTLEGYTVFGNQYDFPIFDGYENYGPSPHWISAKMADWKKAKNLYTNKNNVQMYWSYQYAPKSIGSVELEFYNPNSPSGHQAFIVLWNGVKNYPNVSEVTDPSVVAAKDELKKIADTIDFRKAQ